MPDKNTIAPVATLLFIPIILEFWNIFLRTKGKLLIVYLKTLKKCKEILEILVYYV